MIFIFLFLFIYIDVVCKKCSTWFSRKLFPFISVIYGAIEVDKCKDEADEVYYDGWCEENSAACGFQSFEQGWGYFEDMCQVKTIAFIFLDF